MKPTLKLNGEVYEVIALNYHDGEITSVQIKKENETPLLWNKSFDVHGVTHFSPDTINWAGRYDPVYQAIDELISIYNEQLDCLAKNIAERYVETGTVETATENQYRVLKERVYTTLKMKDIMSEIYDQI